MPTHSCIRCPHPPHAICCICAGHQHGTYGPGEEPEYQSLGEILRQRIAAQPRNEPNVNARLGVQGRAGPLFTGSNNIAIGRDAIAALTAMADRETIGHVGIDLGYLRSNGFVYVRMDSLGVRHLYTQIDGEEQELIAIPAIPATAPPVPPALRPTSQQRTVWDHLTDDDDD